jgi:hypothetical protein
VSADREFVRCVPFEVVCKPHPGRLVCEVRDDGSVGAAWIVYDDCDVPGFDTCETTATGLSTDNDGELVICD